MKAPGGTDYPPGPVPSLYPILDLTLCALY
jgi:hypothetical protein